MVLLKNLKLVEENIREVLPHIGRDQDFLNRTPITDK
jgi:hypothetical protein